MRNRLLALLLLLLTTLGCEKALLRPDPSNDPVSTFEQLWQAVDQKYSFFALKHINWDSVHTAYQARINPGMGGRALFAQLDSMLYLLRDGHVNLVSSFNVSRNWQWYLGYTQNFDFSIIQRYYLGPNYLIAGAVDHIVFKLPNGIKLGYMYVSTFPISGMGASADNALAVFNALGVSAVIIDVRNNGGGALEAADALAARFADQERTVGSIIYKNGPGHDDFTAPQAITVAPDGEERFTGQVLLLTNRSCYSATNYFVMKMRALPNVLQLGDQTGGGGGLPSNGDLPNGWLYRLSTTQLFMPNGYNVELGIAPQVAVNQTQQDTDNHKDSIIEAALSRYR